MAEEGPSPSPPEETTSREAERFPDTTPLVRERAYFLWERAGRPSDREFEFWAQASQEIEACFEEKRQRLQAERIVAR